MPGWRKVLAAMVADGDPRSYSYDDAAKILSRLGFVLARPGKGSHRMWKLAITTAAGEKRTVTIGLVDAGRGTLKPEYIKTMVQRLLENGLVAAEEEGDDDDDRLDS